MNSGVINHAICGVKLMVM